MERRNCWEVFQCGFEPGGKRSDSHVCPAATEQRLDGINGGKNGGRACWAVSKTLCGHGNIYGDLNKKFSECLQCEFFEMVLDEEGREFAPLREIVMRLKSDPTRHPRTDIGAAENWRRDTTGCT